MRGGLGWWRIGFLKLLPTEEPSLPLVMLVCAKQALPGPGDLNQRFADSLRGSRPAVGKTTAIYEDFLSSHHLATRATPSGTVKGHLTCRDSAVFLT